MASLRGKVFRGRRLVGVNFTEADLSGCGFTGVEFEGCYLTGAIVREDTVFDGADLRGAQLSGSQLEKASLSRAIMSAIQAHSLLLDRYGIIIADDGNSRPDF